MTSGLALAFALLVAASCGDETTASGGTASAEPSSRLTITVRESADSTGSTWTLTCDPAGGDHPDPAAACRALDKANDPFGPVSADMMCTEQYGGPQTASIEGEWNGRTVNASYERTDGCEITRWDALAAVLGPGPT
ncbi:MAG: hypothetical protein GEU93_09015 [Propionibacteriales bacterium]|nr:hypothetical protein [Propionibacteriales bacterium]